jgi:hypothetical protein
VTSKTDGASHLRRIAEPNLLGPFGPSRLRNLAQTTTRALPQRLEPIHPAMKTRSVYRVPPAREVSRPDYSMLQLALAPPTPVTRARAIPFSRSKHARHHARRIVGTLDRRDRIASSFEVARASGRAFPPRVRCQILRLAPAHRKKDLTVKCATSPVTNSLSASRAVAAIIKSASSRG